MKFEFTQQEIELINVSLQQQPYKNVFELINHVVANGFELNDNQLTYIINILADEPYFKVVGIINSIQKQINDFQNQNTISENENIIDKDID